MASNTSSTEKPKPSESKSRQTNQLLQPKKLSLNPIINTYTRKLISQREEEERETKNALDAERLRESLDKLKTGKFIHGASTASGDLSIDVQECMSLKWYKDNSKTLWISLVPDDLLTPSKDIYPRQGIFAKSIKDAIHESMSKNSYFSKWFNSKGMILSPVSVDVNNSNPNDITVIFCPPANIECLNLIEQVKLLEAAVPIPYKPGCTPKKPGLFFISFSEFSPLDDVTVLTLSFQISFNADAVRKNFSHAADIIISFFESKHIQLSSPEFELSIPHPIKDDDKVSKGRIVPAKLLITYNAPNLENLKNLTLIVGRMHGANIYVPESIAKVSGFFLRVHCKVFDHRVETERPLWTKDIIESLHTEAQNKAAQNLDSTIKLLFCHHQISEKGENLQGIRAKLNFTDEDNSALSDETLVAKLQQLINDRIIQLSISDPTIFMIAPNRRKWKSLKLIFQDNSPFKLQQKDLGLHLTSSFGLPFDQPIVSMACFYLTTSCAFLSSNTSASFTTYDVWKYMINRFKEYKAFVETTPQSVLAGYATALERSGAIDAERMTPSFLLEYASECAESVAPNSYVNPLAAVCLAFPSEFKKFNWMFVQMKDSVEVNGNDDITSNLEMVYHIKTENKEAKTFFVKFVGSFSQGESFGHFILLNVPPNRSDEFISKCRSSTNKSKYIQIYSTWPSNLFKQFPIQEAQHLIYESSVSQTFETMSPQLQVPADHIHELDGRTDNGDNLQALYDDATYDDDNDHALTNTLQNLDLLNTRLHIAFSRISGYSSLDISSNGREILSRRIDELCIISKEINSHIDQAIALKSQFTHISLDTADELNPLKILEKMDEETQIRNQELEELTAKFKGRLTEIQSLPEHNISRPKPKTKPISNHLFRIRSSFAVDSIASDIAVELSTKRLRLFDTFWVIPIKNSNLSFYHSVLIACSQPDLKSLLLQSERTHFSYILKKEITRDVVKLFEETTKAMFLGFADCAICSLSTTTFNDYLERKQAPKNVWETMPEDHFLCTPSLVAQAWQLNIMIVWKRKGITKVFALPYGPHNAPIIPILFSADKSQLGHDGNPVIVLSPTANRFFPLSPCEDKAYSWEESFVAVSEIPDSVQSTSLPIITAKFVKKTDKEFAFQSSVMVDGPGKGGKEISEDEVSERTVDGLTENSQALMDSFINDQSDNEEHGPPSYNPILEEVDKNMAMRKLTEANMTMFKKIRRIRILDDDDDDVPILCIEPPVTRTPHTATVTSNKSTASNRNTSTSATTARTPELPAQNPPINSTTSKPTRPQRTIPSKTHDGKNATPATGNAERGSSK